MEKMQLILVVPPEDPAAAEHLPAIPAHPLYRLGQGGHLFRSTAAGGTRRGFMLIDDLAFDGTGEPAVFSREVVQECLARRFSGVVLSFDRPPAPRSLAMVSRLSRSLARRQLPLYLPEAYAPASETAKILVSSALSGGSLHQRLSDAATRFGISRITLAAERVAVDFTLPAPDGAGTSLTPEALFSLRQVHAPSVFFSSELCSHYFTYLNSASHAHFVLFDDGDSMRKKLQLARSLGIREALLFYPDIAPWADAFF
ncbi:MAG: hypothetical protein IIY71_03165 [Oscillospiraceae bacterium]|nr:hypothetical protein [Oscillospiraceae bacterium]